MYRLESDHPEKKGEEYSWPYQLQMFHGDFYVRNGEVHEIPENTDGWGQTVYSTGTLRRGILMVPGRWKGSLKVSLPMLLEDPLINSLLFI